MLAKPHEDLVNVGTEISANDKTYEINPAFKPIIESKILDIEGTPPHIRILCCPRMPCDLIGKASVKCSNRKFVGF